MNKKGSLFVVSAPSGAGKTTLCKKLIETLPGIRFSVSYTTRKPRPGEADGIDYHFVDEETFKKMIEDGEFIEWALVHGNLYGTSKNRLREVLDSGTDIILDIDTQGASKIKETPEGKEGVYIFVLPPSIQTLRDRLRGRMSDTDEEILRRLKKARDEIRQYPMYNYVIVNDLFAEALTAFRRIVEDKRAGGRSGIKGADPDWPIRPEWIEKNFLSEEVL